MPTAIAMPKLGLKMEEGTVLEWQVRPGESVEKGQVVLLIESDKAEAEIEAPAAGLLCHVYVEPDQTVPCGAFLGVLTDSSDAPFDAEAFRREREPKLTARKPVAPAAPRAREPAAPGSGPRPGAPVTPAARRRAAELGVDPARVRGTGPAGRVTREDVEAWAEQMAARAQVADGVWLDAPALGKGDPVLLLPGFGTDVAAFARQVPALAGRYRVRGVNPRGVGASDAPEAECYDVPTAAQDAAALAEKPAHVIGASLGAAVALELALGHTQSVRSLTLITPFLCAPARLLAVIDAWCRLAAEATPEGVARAIVPWLFSPRTLAEPRALGRAVRGFTETSGRIPAPTLERAAAGLRAWSGTREDALGELRVPTLVLGATEDLLTPDAQAVADRIGGAKCVIVRDAGHAVALEAPDAVNAPLLEHLAGS